MFHHPDRAVGSYSSGSPALEVPELSQHEVCPDLMNDPVKDHFVEVCKLIQPPANLACDRFLSEGMPVYLFTPMRDYVQ